MINQQLIDYVKQKMHEGVSKEIITNNLIIQGHSQQDCDIAFSAVENAELAQSATIAQESSTKISKNSIILLSCTLILLVAGGWYYLRQRTNERRIALLADISCITVQTMKEFLVLHPEIKSREDINEISTQDAADFQQSTNEKTTALLKKYNLTLEEFRDEAKKGQETIRNSTSLSKKFMNLIAQKGCLPTR